MYGDCIFAGEGISYLGVDRGLDFKNSAGLLLATMRKWNYKRKLDKKTIFLHLSTPTKYEPFSLRSTSPKS